MDRWLTKNIPCEGGLDVTTGLLEQGTIYTGSARELINYEPADVKGYRKILGYIKYDDDVVPGDALAPVTGVQPYADMVLAVRYSTPATSNDVYKSSGSGWTKVNSAARPGSVSKARIVTYSITTPVAIILDGVNRALKYNGTTDVLLNTTGAPVNPKYGVQHNSRLVLSGYSSNKSAITLSAPNNDEDYTGASGAIEINVGDIVTGLATFREILYIFCESSIHKLVGNDATNYQILSVTSKIGCVSGDTIQEIAGDLLFLAPDGLRSLAATEKFNDIELGLQSIQIQPKIRSTIQSLPTVYSSLVVPSKSQYELYYHRAGVADTAQKGYLGKYRPTERYNYSWAELSGINMYSCGTKYFSNNDSIIVFGHPTNGYVYRMQSGGSFDGAPISCVYKSPPLTFDDIRVNKVVYKLETIAEASTPVEISVKNILDEYSDRKPLVQPVSKSIAILGGASLYDVATYDVAVYARESSPTITNTKLEGSGETITIQYSSYDTIPSHRIDSFTISYSTKARDR